MARMCVWGDEEEEDGRERHVCMVFVAHSTRSYLTIPSSTRLTATRQKGRQEQSVRVEVT